MVKYLERSNVRLNTYTMVICALFAALIAVGAFIKIPVYPVPLTLQVQIVTIAGLMLGGKRGAVSVFIYIAVGLAGLPVFARGGGIGYVLQPTFGYILGFVSGAYISGRLAEKAKDAAFKGYFLASMAGLLSVYITGVFYFYFISRFYLGKEIGIWFLLLNCFLITLPGDIILCALGALLAVKLKPVTSRYFNLQNDRKGGVP